jgi:hypothetical protein
MNHHEGAGVIPGRYAGEAIPIHDGPTPQELASAEQRAHADALAGRICAAAAEASRSQYVLLQLVGEFDARVRSGIGPISNHWRIGCPGVAR